MQKLFVQGRLGRDAEIRETTNGSRYLRFTLAANWRKGKGTPEKTTWYEVLSFNPLHTGPIAQHLKSGTCITVVGNLEAELTQGKDGRSYMNLRLRADSIEFIPFVQRQDNGYRGDDSFDTGSIQPQAVSTPTPVVVPETAPTVTPTTMNDIPDGEIACTPNSSSSSVTTKVMMDDDDDLPF